MQQVQILTAPRRRAAAVLALGVALAAALSGCASESLPSSLSLTPPARTAPTAAPADPESTARAAGDEQEGAVKTTETGNELLLVSLARSDEIAIVDPSQPNKRAVRDRIRVGAAPWGVGVAPDGRIAYAATAEGLAVVDLQAGERTALAQYQHPAPVISIGEYRPGGLGLAVSPDGARVYVAVTTPDDRAALEVFDTRSGSFIDSVPVGLRPFNVLVAPDGSWAATVDHDGFTVTVVDAETLRATQHTVAPFGTAGGLASWEKPHYGAVDAEGFIWLPYQGLEVAKLDPRTGKYTTVPSAASSHSHGTALAGDRLLTVGTGAFGNASGEPNLSILDLASGSEDIVSLDQPHETVAAWSDADGHEFAAVAGGNTRDAGWDGISLVDLEQLDVRRIPVPGYPQDIAGFVPGV